MKLIISKGDAVLKDNSCEYVIAHLYKTPDGIVVSDLNDKPMRVFPNQKAARAWLETDSGLAKEPAAMAFVRWCVSEKFDSRDISWRAREVLAAKDST